MSDINLSKAVRSNLLSLQNTATMMAKTQERLATGLKVNSALDNPTSFFTASALKSRAGDLGQLMDSVGNAVQTIAAADKGIKAITDLVKNAQAIARQALQATVVTTDGPGGGGTGPVASVDSQVNLANDGVASLVGAADSFLNLATNITALTDGDILEVTIGGETHELVYDSSGDGDFEDATTLTTALSDLGITLADDGSDAAQLTADRDFSIDGTATGLGLAGDSSAATSTDIAALTGTIDYTIGEDSGTIDLATFANVDEMIATFEGAGFTVEYDGDTGFMSISATESFTLTDGGLGEVAAVFGAGATSGELVEVDEDNTGAPPATGETSKRAQLLEQYNDILGQIDDLVRDTHFNGVNLLNDDNLQVIFNEDGTSKLDIKGVTFNAEGLGLYVEDAGAFDTNDGINGVLDKLKAGIETLRTQASTFGSNLSVVETRQNFTKDMINVLETGAANLTLADTNEEAANLLALQTRQQLSSTALSMASQADQAVLRLF